MKHFSVALFLMMSLALAGCEPQGLSEGRAAYDRGEFGVALSALRPLADAGDTEALRLLGFMYHGGKGVARDYGAAVKLWREAADESDPASQHARGLALQLSAFEEFFQGKGADNQRFGAALMWFRLAAEQGFAPAQSYLGDMYLKFDFAGIPPDTAEGEKWLRRAAEQGDLNGQINLGDLYNDGLGVPKNPLEAATWYRRAAEQGDRTTQAILARMYRDGRGVPKDLVRAQMWFDIAIANGERSLIPVRELTARKLTAGQITDAKRLATDWLAQHGRGS